MFDLKALLRVAKKRNASDVHIKSGIRPALRVQGDLLPITSHPIISKQDTLDVTHHILNTRQKETLARKSELDLAFGGSDIGRFRLAVFHQRGSVSMVFRLIPDKVPTTDELHLPQAVNNIADGHRGFVLVTGATGSGKSTTLSAMLQHINLTRRTHILTVEDPIEFLLKDNLSIISQREVNVDTESFSTALRAAMRQDPDVVMVGEMRDLETVMTALQAAETGHLVMSTLHTTDATETVNRVISMFPADQQNDVRYRFAASLSAIVSMRLIKSSLDGKRYPAVEILRNTDLVRSMIEEPDKLRDLRETLESGKSQYGMQSFDQSILSHYKAGNITAEDALANASSPDDLRLRLDGIVGSTETV
jgi:twitching motility protein PilT